MTVEEALARHAEKYPFSAPRDMVKMLYQAQFGGGHMIPDQEKSLRRLRDEMATAQGGDLFEDIGGGMCRMMLSPLRGTGMSAETANAMFVHGANSVRGSMGSFLQSLSALEKAAREGKTPFSAAELTQYLKSYAAEGYPTVSHSETYREKYHPAYRVVPCAYRDYFELFLRLDRLLCEKERATIVIDGNSASGKSTLGQLVADTFSANLFHMDDFFLPPDRKTPERLSEPGGNVDYERFDAEVLKPLKSGAAFAYRPYSCAQGRLKEPVRVTPNRLNVVEGAYGMHPYFGDPYDLRVFLSIDPEKQKQRILSRNGPEMLRRFTDVWIPLENAYFEKLHIPEKCDIVF